MLASLIRSAVLSVSVAAIPASAQEPDDLNAAIAYYAFRDLEAMPILRNRSLQVGDVMILNKYEDVIAAASRCYLALETMREQANGVDSFRSHNVRVSLETVADVAAGADIRGLVRIDAKLRGLYEDSAAIIFTDVIGILPSPDIQALFAENVERIETCTPTLELLASHRYDRLLATRIYQGAVTVGFAFNAAGGADIGAATARLIQHVTDASAKISADGGLTKVIVDEWTNGVIAVQSSRLDRKRLAEAWLLMNEDAATVAELERLLNEYLGEENPNLRQDIVWSIRSFLEEYGLSDESIDTMRRKIFAGEEAEGYSPDEIPDEHWRAAGAVAAALIIVNAN